MNADKINEKIGNLEFQIVFSETNLRYLAGEPESVEKQQAVAVNKGAIQEAHDEIARLKRIPAA